MKSIALIAIVILATFTVGQSKKSAPESKPKIISHYMQRIGLLYLDTDNDLNDAEYAVGDDRNEAQIASLNKSLDHIERSTRIEIKEDSVDSSFLDDLVMLRTKRSSMAALARSHQPIPPALSKAVLGCKAEADTAIDTGKVETYLHYQCIEFTPDN